jgi:hypothetical protein
VFRVILSTNLTTSAVIGSSGRVRVVANNKFAVAAFVSAVLPCQPGNFCPGGQCFDLNNVCLFKQRVYAKNGS